MTNTKAHLGSTTMEIALEPKTVSYSPRNGPELAQTVIDDDRHVSPPWSSTTMEIALERENGE